MAYKVRYWFVASGRDGKHAEFERVGSLPFAPTAGLEVWWRTADGEDQDITIDSVAWEEGEETFVCHVGDDEDKEVEIDEMIRSHQGSGFSLKKLWSDY